ncbi:unnamed protein product [Rotaria socialis]|uniref:Helix-turn-helix domain-containing protein n=1 Tax=Rotaria socialis TaxID=392032 RepID=A0A820KVE3_9BILA|nr:unnamed protein product [Rotaria socialis]
MIPRQNGQEVFRRFLECHLKRSKTGTLSIDDLMKMASLVLDNNYFMYQGKYYQQIRELSQHQLSNNEIYGRYIDDVFMTTNLSQDQIKIQLDKVAKKDPNIEITYSIASCVDFPDVIINNGNGKLTTSIYHKPAAEPHILPYTSDHSRHVHRNIPYAALLSAARLCSNIDGFHMDRHLSQKQFLRFFQTNKVLPVLQQSDAIMYDKLHSTLLQQSTRHKPWNPNFLYVPHRFATGPALTFKHRFRAWWKKYYLKQESKVAHVKVKFATKTNRTLENIFVHKKFHKAKLTKRKLPQ